MISGNLPADHAKIHAGRGEVFQIECEAPLCIHTDGEFFSVPEEGIKSVEVSIQKQCLQVAYDPASLYGQ